MYWLQAFYRPSSVAEAVRVMAKSGKRARFVGGGTDVLVRRDRNIDILIDISRIGLNYIKPEAALASTGQGGGWVIGAGTTLTTIERSQDLAEFANGILARAAASAGSEQIRNAATIGGNLANGSPAADMALPLLALGASVVVIEPGKYQARTTRQMTDFFLAPHKTVLSHALLVEIHIPPVPTGRAGWSFQKMHPIGGSLAIVNVAAGLGLDRRKHCAWARIAIGAAAPKPLRMRVAEKLLVGAPLDDASLTAAAEAVSQNILPQTDGRATADYRRAMSKVLVKRALRECLEKI
jgi:CO/xanthine dehydrogenase FAD-binding subunit